MYRQNHQNHQTEQKMSQQKEEEIDKETGGQRKLEQNHDICGAYDNEIQFLVVIIKLNMCARVSIEVLYSYF